MSGHLALVACLDESRSVHSRTFKRAIVLFQDYIRSHAAPAVPMVCYDDGADAATAARVAGQIVAERPCAVVGHFASSAAAAAAPIYAQAGLALLLPAATARQLTVHAGTWRVCAHDDAYVAALAAFCARRRLQIRQVQHDGSVHGLSIARAVQTSDAPGRACTLFSGSCASAIDFLARHGAAVGPLIFTDDALSAQIVAPALARGGEVLVFGLAAQPAGAVAAWLQQAWERQFGTLPATYFWETVAAIQVASASAGQGLGTQAWDTVLGPLRFDASRETGLASFAGYAVTQQGLQELRP